LSRPTTLLLLALLCGAIALALGLYGDWYVSLAGPRFAGLANLLADSGLARGLVAATVGLLVLLAVGFYLPVAMDVTALMLLNGRVERLSLESTPEALLAAFRSSPLLAEGRNIATGLWQSRTGIGAINPAWRSPGDPADALQPQRATREAEGAFYATVSLVLLGLGVAAVLWLDRGGAPDSPGHLPGQLSGAIIGLGIASFLLVRLLTHLRVQQISDIASGIRAHFPPAATEFLVDRMSGLSGEDAAARAAAIDNAGRSIADGLAKAIDELKTALMSHDRRIAASVAQAVQRVAQPIATSVEETLGRLEAENTAKAQQLLQGVLGEFVSTFEKRFATQMQEVADLLAGTRVLAEELREAFVESETQRTKQSEKLNAGMLESVKRAVEDAARRQSEALKALVERVGDAVAGTADGLARVESRTSAAAERWTAQTEAIVNAVVARSGDEMRRTATAFGQLHDILETLSLSVLPAINRLVTTQERLQAAIESNRGSAQSSAEAARDLGEAARIAREMVERQMAFTRELAQFARGAESAAATAETEKAAAKAAPSGDPDADFARALVDLGNEADDDIRELPQL
jgi:hypothetical protein